MRNNRTLFSKRFWELFLIDTGIMVCIWFFMRFLATIEVSSLTLNGDFSINKMAALYLCIMVMRTVFSMYSTVLRYADAKLYCKLLIADLSAELIYLAIARFVYNPIYVGFAYTVIITSLITWATLASRLVYQLAYAYFSTVSDNKTIKLKQLLFKNNEELHKINVAIVGAGNVGASLATEFQRNVKSHYTPVMFIDKDTRKIGSAINGIRIYPENDEIIDMIRSMPIQEIIIALPDASFRDRVRLYDFYKETNCKVKLYDYPLGDRPGEKSVEGGRIALRDFRIEDLLFRDSINLKSPQTKKFYKDKVILVTGGGGSIGSELCRQIAKMHPKKLVILDIYENNIYDIQQELLRVYGAYDPKTKTGLNIKTVIASVRDVARLDEIFAEVRPQIVFHAAAHKHVPMMEYNGCEAIKNNVFGTYNVANVSEKYGVEKFLLISTDKAVNPTNIMGASKRLCEMVIQSRTESDTVFSVVRFGNVLGSNGSVIPLFKKQIETGGPITLTDKRIIRYFMTIPEAAGLVMETCVMAENGELYVLDMGKPVKILDLAENMIRLSGLKPYEDIEIEEIGLRPGEKLYEELLMKTEELDKTESDLIFIERDQAFSRIEIEQKLEILRNAITDYSAEDSAFTGHHDAVLEAIRRTVPTFHSPKEINDAAEESEEMQEVLRLRA